MKTLKNEKLSFHIDKNRNIRFHFSFGARNCFSEVGIILTKKEVEAILKEMNRGDYICSNYNIQDLTKL